MKYLAVCLNNVMFLNEVKVFSNVKILKRELVYKKTVQIRIISNMLQYYIKVGNMGTNAYLF